MSLGGSSVQGHAPPLENWASTLKLEKFYASRSLWAPADVGFIVLNLALPAQCKSRQSLVKSRSGWIESTHFPVLYPLLHSLSYSIN